MTTTSPSTVTETPTNRAFVVRPAQPADAAALRELRIDALARHPEAFAADLDAAVAEPPATWEALIADNAAADKGVICVAETAAGLVGMAGLVRGRWPKTWSSGTIWGVYVRPDWRGLGVGAALLDACADWGRAHGMTIIKLAVVTTNAAAIRSYARCGFTVYGVEPQVMRVDGVDYDELLMAREL